MNFPRRGAVLLCMLAGTLAGCAAPGKNSGPGQSAQYEKRRIVYNDSAAIRAAIRSNHLGLAIQLGKQYLANHPEHWETRVTLAQVYAQLGRDDEAELVLQPVIASKQPLVLRERARIALARLQAVQAQAWLEEALSSTPQLPEAENLLGVALDLQGQNLRAQAYYRAALTAQEDDDTRYNLAYSLLASAQPAAAIQVLEPLMERTKRPAVHAAMATALLRSGDLARARALAQIWMTPQQLQQWLTNEGAS